MTTDAFAVAVAAVVGLSAGAVTYQVIFSPTPTPTPIGLNADARYDALNAAADACARYAQELGSDVQCVWGGFVPGCSCRQPMLFDAVQIDPEPRSLGLAMCEPGTALHVHCEPGERSVFRDVTIVNDFNDPVDAGCTP